MKFPSRSLRNMLIVVTYAIVLYLFLSHLETIKASFQYLTGVLTPIIIGVCIAYVVNLLLKVVEERLLAPLWRRVPRLARAKRAIGILLTLLIIVLILAGLVTFIVPQLARSVSSLAVQIPAFLSQASAWIAQLAQQYELTNNLWTTLSQNWREIASTVSTFLSATLPQLFSWTMGVTNSVVNTILGITFALYMLADKERLINMFRKLIYAFLPRSWSDRVCSVCHDANRIFSSFITGQIVEACILGCLCGVGMAILRFPYALLIGVVVGITALIPILGAYIGTIPSAFIILMESGPLRAIGFVLFIICLQQFEGNVIYPKVVGTSIGLRGIWVLAAITVGGSLFGLPGMVVGVPVFAVLYTLVRRYTYNRLRDRDVPVEDEEPDDILKADRAGHEPEVKDHP